MKDEVKHTMVVYDTKGIRYHAVKADKCHCCEQCCFEFWPEICNQATCIDATGSYVYHESEVQHG